MTKPRAGPRHRGNLVVEEQVGAHQHVTKGGGGEQKPRETKRPLRDAGTQVWITRRDDTEIAQTQHKTAQHKEQANCEAPRKQQALGRLPKLFFAHVAPRITRTKQRERVENGREVRDHDVECGEPRQSIQICHPLHEALVLYGL
jgi:hypothetical protein